MGKCKDCTHWTRDVNQAWELEAIHLDNGIERSALERGYGRCLVAKQGAAMVPQYDGGYTGQLLTKADFGCNQFRAHAH